MTPTVQTVLPAIAHGDHCCLVFSSTDDQVAVSIPFLALGLERDERSVYVGDRTTIDRLRSGLAEAGVEVEREIGRGRLVLDDARDYLDDGHFSTDKMLGFLQHTYEDTIGSGYTALRAAGDVSWQVGPDRDFKDVVYYEALLDVFFLGKRMVGMCQYAKSRCPPEVLNGILGTHKIAAIDDEVCSNFHYTPPEILLEKDEHVRHARRVDWMTSQLRRARQAEAEILRLNADLERRVKERTAELEAANRELESFSYSVSHDLRAPLRAVDGFSAALQEDYGDTLPEGAHTHLTRIRQGAQNMGRLIDDLLRLARIGRKGIARKGVDMAALVRSVAEETGASIAPSDTIPAVVGDEPLLRQVMVNLLSNAVKFTRGVSAPRIEVSARMQGDMVECCVSDNGAGFDMEYADKLFAPFQRLHRQEEFEGTGIGLAIVRRIVELHGGRIRAEARLGEGAKFLFTLPLAPDGS
jgi:signal transduction histidine kinase